MKMREQLSGSTQVFRFTLRQFFRSRANNISLLVTLLVVLASMPLMTYIQGGQTAQQEERAELAWVAVDNRTALPLSASMLAQEPFWSETKLTDGPSQQADAVVTVTGDAAGYTVAVTGQGSGYDLSILEMDMCYYVEQARIAASGISQQQLDVLYSDYYVGEEPESSAEEIWLETDDEAMPDGFWVQYGYAIAVMMLCLMSASYVIRAVVEEKDSKLIELLLLSVKPLALLMGKILAAMVYVFGMLLMMLLGWVGSLAITAAVFGKDSVAHITGTLAEILSMEQVDITQVLTIGTVLVVSLLLGYLTMSMIGGLSGACCSGMEEAGSASSTVTLVTMVGYLGACVFGAIPGKGVALFSSLCPVLSMFCAPVQYVQGNISFWVLLVSWVLQAAVVALLALLAARVYADLIIYRGSRIRYKELLRMARSGKEAV